MTKTETPLTERPWQNMSYPDFVEDSDGLDRWRQHAREGSGHAMAEANKNTLFRMVQTIDQLKWDLAQARASSVPAMEGETARLREAFSFVCGLLPGGAAAMDREADTYVLNCMVNIGELKRVRHYRAILAQPADNAPQDSGWLPIGSAPTDGTHILVCDARVPFTEFWTFNQRPPVVVHWWPSLSEQGFYWSTGSSVDDLPGEYTHWRPLPPSPFSQGIG